MELIETLLREPDGRIALLDTHLTRLQRSAAALGFHVDESQVRSALAAVPADTNGQSQRLRLLLAKNGQVRVQHAVLTPLSSLPAVSIWPATLPAEEPLLRHKTTHRPWYAVPTQWLSTHPDWFDVLLFNERDELCEGSRSNVYVYRDGVWLTPPMTSGLLPGVMRQTLLTQRQVREAILTRADLEAATECRLSNALRGWFEVRLAPLPAH